MAHSENGLLRFIQNFVKKSRDVRDSVHGVLVVHAGGADNGQRTHHFSAHAGRSADQDEVTHRRQGFVEADNNTDSFLFRVKVGIQKLHNFFIT